MANRPRVVALVAAYNEADVIGQTMAALIADGIEVYYVDNDSTDGTLAEVEKFQGRGVIGIERLPAPRDAATGRRQYAWGGILARKEALANQIEADWFIHHDADEFRESPWPDESLVDGISRVDAAGYNAIDFDVINFRPTTADPTAVADVRERMRFCERAGEFDRVQVKCWKRTGVPVSLAASGGHGAEFDNRRVFPVRFLLRHYPIRSQAHGERKVFQERVPQFDEAERARGWHVQYDGMAQGMSFVRDPSTLTQYDADAARIHVFVHNREVERLQHDLALSEARARELDRVLKIREATVEQLMNSKSWKLTAPLRATQAFLQGKRRRTDSD